MDFNHLGYFVVETMRVELMSKSISAGVSPSAVNGLVFRILGRPLTGCRFIYPVESSGYQEITEGFPV